MCHSRSGKNSRCWRPAKRSSSRWAGIGGTCCYHARCRAVQSLVQNWRTEHCASGLEDKMVSDSERIRELEERLEALERELKGREGGHLSNFLESLVPAEVREHMRTAAREQMLAVSSYLNHMA